MPREPFDPLLPERRTKPVAFAFVLDRIERCQPSTRPMFGCTAVYVDERIVFILRERGDSDDGVWLAFEPAREREVLALFPRLQPIELFAGKVRGWRKLSAASEHFEDDVEAACRLVRAADARLGKVPSTRKPSDQPEPRRKRTDKLRKPQQNAELARPKRKRASQSTPRKRSRGATR